MKSSYLMAAVTVSLLNSIAFAAPWEPFVIRNSTSGNIAPTISVSGNQTEIVTSLGGQKAGLGTSAADGAKVSQILALSIDRLDDTSRFTPGSGQAVAPYLNIWITNGTKYAVIANEPSNAEWAGGLQWDMTWNILKTKTLKVYENSDKSWLPNNGVGLTFNDVASFTIKAPTPTEIAAGWAGLGGGAPRELGTNEAYGVNWVFGDTLSNYVSGGEGYIVADASISVVPEPASLSIVGLGAAALLMRRRRAGK